MILPCAQKYLITITANSEDLFWCQLRQQSPYYIMSLNLRDVLCRTHQKSSLLILSLNRYLAAFTLMYSTEEKPQCFSFKVEENECVLIFSILVLIVSVTLDLKALMIFNLSFSKKCFYSYRTSCVLFQLCPICFDKIFHSLF